MSRALWWRLENLLSDPGPIPTASIRRGQAAGLFFEDVEKTCFNDSRVIRCAPMNDAVSWYAKKFLSTAVGPWCSVSMFVELVNASSEWTTSSADVDDHVVHGDHVHSRTPFVAQRAPVSTTDCRQTGGGEQFIDGHVG